jgi:hypothetical protein
MASSARTNGEAEREMDPRFAARIEAEIARLREQSQKTIEEFKRSFPPPSDEQIERLLYPELSEIKVELGGRNFILRELPALYEKKFLRLVEQKLPALVTEILSLDERMAEPADRAAGTFANIFTQAQSALELISDACALVLDPAGAERLTRDFVQQNASTARQLRILKAQLMLNGARDFLSRLFPALGATSPNEAPIRGSLAPSAGSSSSANRQGTSPGDSPSDNWL